MSHLGNQSDWSVYPSYHQHVHAYTLYFNICYVARPHRNLPLIWHQQFKKWLTILSAWCNACGTLWKGIKETWKCSSESGKYTYPKEEKQTGKSSELGKFLERNSPLQCPISRIIKWWIFQDSSPYWQSSKWKGVDRSINLIPHSISDFSVCEIYH